MSDLNYRIHRRAGLLAVDNSRQRSTKLMIPKTLTGHNVAWTPGEKLSISLSTLSVWPFSTKQSNVRLLSNLWMALTYYTFY